MLCLIFIPTVEWTSDEVVAVYNAFCTLPKEEQRLSLELAVASKYAAEDVDDNTDFDQHHEAAEGGEFNTCLFVAPFYLATYT